MTSFIRYCGAIALVCAAWNLFGDLYFLDFYTAHLSQDSFGLIDSTTTDKVGYLFSSSALNNPWIAFIAQSGGWMYPLWAFVTAVPLFIGLGGWHQHQPAINKQGGANPTALLSSSNGAVWWKQPLYPCVLLCYGLCVVGGGLHNSFVYLTVLPSVLSTTNLQEGESVQQSFLDDSQNRIVQHIIVGCFPGLVACNVAAIWIAVLVQFGNDTVMLSKWFNLCNPVVTTIWIQTFAAICLPEKWAFYVVGCLGTWGLLIFNLGISYYLWNDKSLSNAEESVSLASTTPIVREYRTLT